MNNHDDVNTPVIAAIGLVAILLLVAFVLFLQVVYYQADAQQEEKAIAQQPVELIDLKTQQQARLASYAWVDAKKRDGGHPHRPGHDAAAGRFDPRHKGAEP